MKILVIDDRQIHRDAALAQLSKHDVTVACSHDEALELLDEAYWLAQNAASKLLDEQGPSWPEEDDPDKDQKRQQRIAARNHLVRAQYGYDAVLCDLLMPAGKDAQGDEGMAFVGQEVPVGFALALTAALHGAKYVAVVTDTNHHSHPASAMLDRIKTEGRYDHSTNIPRPGGARFEVNGSRLAFIQQGVPEGEAKQWGEVLKGLVEQEVQPQI